MQTLRHSIHIQAAPAAVQRALLDAAVQRRILGGECDASADAGAPFLLMDGLITGTNAYVAPGEVVQSWRMGVADWPAECESRVAIRLRAEGDGTRLELAQSWIPSGCLPAVEQHWKEHVWPGLRTELEPRARLELGLRARVRRLLKAN